MQLILLFFNSPRSIEEILLSTLAVGLILVVVAVIAYFAESLLHPGIHAFTESIKKEGFDPDQIRVLTNCYKSTKRESVLLIRDKRYNFLQMKQIFVGLMDDLDVSSILDPSIPWEEMNQKLKVLKQEKTKQLQ